jgi:hypothetical protein
MTLENIFTLPSEYLDLRDSIRGLSEKRLLHMHMLLMKIIATRKKHTMHSLNLGYLQHTFRPSLVATELMHLLLASSLKRSLEYVHRHH